MVMPVVDPEIVRIGVDPIAGASPGGISVRYDPDFEQLDAEISKLESVRENVQVDWSEVVRISSSILKTKSKDYRVAGYLLMGLYQTAKVDGLLIGLRLYTGLVRNFWETAFPEKTRLRGRIGALEWLSGRLGTALSRESVKASDESILELQKTTVEFLASLADFMGDQAPSFADLKRAVDERVREVRSRQATAEHEKENEERRTAAVASGEVTEVADAEKVIEECRSKLAKVADFLFRADSSDALSYALTRSFTWGWLAAVPTNDIGVTHIPPAPPNSLQRCKSFAAEGNWNAVLEDTESGFLERVFAFDLQYQCIQALDHLGEPYKGAKQTVISELAGLLGRFPEIISLKFNDKSPFADAQTIAWMKEEVLRSSPTGSEPKSEPDAVQESSGLTDAVSEAKRLLANGKLQEAIALFREGITKAPLRRLRFLWRLQLAKLCMEAGKLQLALPQLTSLDEDVRQFSLEEWEPGLSLEVIQNLYLCRQKLAVAASQGLSAEVENQLAQLYQRLCKLDVNAALAVES
jgi:type VI secretion system protein VasJ